MGEKCRGSCAVCSGCCYDCDYGGMRIKHHEGRSYICVRSNGREKRSVRCTRTIALAS